MAAQPLRGMAVLENHRESQRIAGRIECLEDEPAFARVAAAIGRVVFQVNAVDNRQQFERGFGHIEVSSRPHAACDFPGRDNQTLDVGAGQHGVAVDWIG